MKFFSILAILIVCLILVGCGEYVDNQPEYANNVPYALNSPELSVKVGLVGPFTGDVAVLGEPLRDTVMFAAEEYNAKGGLQIEVIPEDGMCNGKESSIAVQKLISVDKVDFIIGPMCSAETLAAAPIAEEAGVVIMSPSSTSPAVKNAGDYIFRIVPSDAGQGKRAAELMFDSENLNVAILGVNDEWGAAITSVFEQEFIALGGNIVTSELFEPKSSDLRTQLSKIKDSDVDGIYFVGFPKEAIVFLTQKEELGLDAFVVGADASVNADVISGAANAAEGFISILPSVPESEEFNDFKESYLEWFGTEQYGAYTPEIYDIFNIMANAFETVGSDRDAIKEYLYSMGLYKGASGEFEFDSFGEVEKAYDVFIVEEGKFIHKE
jgi:branched-chain amino acid transport system substrate-binding protein